MKISKLYLFPIALLMLSSCKISVNALENATITTATTTPKNIALNGKIYSAVWQQNSGEFMALSYQAYNIATYRLDEALKMKKGKPLAIITDVDETFLDNSPYAVTESEKGKDFNDATWANWTAKANAKAYPGSLDFFKYAASKNVKIFYITNRNENDKAGTLKNLKDLGFPNADEQYVVVRSTTSDKEERRNAVLKNYNVVLYLGDNLGDFANMFYKKTQAERNQNVENNADLFGKKFIMLPNSGYGDWESAMPGFNYKLTPAQKDSVILKNVVGY
ncbi:5'-nucleotidase, lipoprotein e(P4) family [Frigoriflavimonas asaccharolytica]|uniref:5'-nucleotidase (Lipoprotein e(P4) family) n=1 Tax=Frigoriflavimonas asaccharolytica TaxID=2735899 RepID=A0A8J8G948_9FLAO|nr:5'-nucleotidase, lipoprotein e(P4) family [Frigoriflavimonas asaccharolytica]NRS93596.1 5'-nucleotidase (lipoprotein e(P4) family) [Frigoriflavimonas asaccharolytica]